MPDLIFSPENGAAIVASNAAESDFWKHNTREDAGPDEVTHACPPGDSALTPCCGLTPFELPLTDQLTLDPELVDCPGAARP